MVTVKWANSRNPNSYNCHDEDMAVLVLYFPEKEASLVFRNEAVRRDEMLAVALPGVYAGCSLHAWLIFASRRGRGVVQRVCYVEGLVSCGVVRCGAVCVDGVVKYRVSGRQEVGCIFSICNKF